MRGREKDRSIKERKKKSNFYYVCLVYEKEILYIQNTKREVRFKKYYIYIY